MEHLREQAGVEEPERERRSAPTPAQAAPLSVAALHAAVPAQLLALQRGAGNAAVAD